MSSVLAGYRATIALACLVSFEGMFSILFPVMKDQDLSQALLGNKRGNTRGECTANNVYVRTSSRRLAVRLRARALSEPRISHLRTALSVGVADELKAKLEPTART